MKEKRDLKWLIAQRGETMNIPFKEFKRRYLENPVGNPPKCIVITGVKL